MDPLFSGRYSGGDCFFCQKRRFLTCGMTGRLGFGGSQAHEYSIWAKQMLVYLDLLRING